LLFKGELFFHEALKFEMRKVGLLSIFHNNIEIKIICKSSYFYMAGWHREGDFSEM